MNVACIYNKNCPYRLKCVRIKISQDMTEILSNIGCRFLYTTALQS